MGITFQTCKAPTGRTSPTQAKSSGKERADSPAFSCLPLEVTAAWSLWSSFGRQQG